MKGSACGRGDDVDPLATTDSSFRSLSFSFVPFSFYPLKAFALLQLQVA